MHRPKPGAGGLIFSRTNLQAAGARRRRRICLDAVLSRSQVCLENLSSLSQEVTRRLSSAVCLPQTVIRNAEGRRFVEAVWWSQTGSNRRPPACKAGALPTELWPLQAASIRTSAARLSVRVLKLVGLGRFELPTSRLSSARSNQLSYKPAPGVSNQKPAIRSTFGSDY